MFHLVLRWIWHVQLWQQMFWWLIKFAILFDDLICIILSCIVESSVLRWNMCLWFKPHQFKHQKKTSNQHSLEMCPFLKGSTWGQVKRYHFHSNSRLDWVSFDWIIGPLAAKRKEESKGERKGLGERRGQALNLPQGLAFSATQTIRILSLTEGVVFLSSLSFFLSLSLRLGWLCRSFCYRRWLCWIIMLICTWHPIHK